MFGCLSDEERQDYEKMSINTKVIAKRNRSRSSQCATAIATMPGPEPFQVGVPESRTVLPLASLPAPLDSIMDSLGHLQGVTTTEDVLAEFRPSLAPFSLPTKLRPRAGLNSYDYEVSDHMPQLRF